MQQYVLEQDVLVITQLILLPAADFKVFLYILYIHAFPF